MTSQNMIDEDAYMMIQRKKMTIYLNINKSTPVNVLKKMVGGIIKTSPENLQLHYKNVIMDGKKTLSDYFDSSMCLDPVSIGLSLKMDNGEFEPLNIVPVPEPL
ncbi:uncharacterized protein LOC132942090 [Metopolophium dirhodum]|uniref:uncharacterized protein LOC132942090 n=1 Tax=Metopolophium dirhodum TaxID=44670 RepID=UPI00299080F3|nr:uncharacterized protein LOC132942090 [Metopolophium dirhodum]